MKLSTFRLTMLLVSAWFCLGSVTPISAGLLPNSQNVVFNDADYRYNYGVVLTSDSTLKTGDFFTIYDFSGYVPGSNIQPANFKFSSALSGPTPAGTLPADNPAITNLTWTYTGPATLTGQSMLGDFAAQSQYASTAAGVFTALTHCQVDGQADSNITSTPVPVAAVPGVPEPCSLALIGVALTSTALVRRRQI